MPLLTAVTPLVSAAAAYLIAIRGEIEVQKGDERIKFKNITPSKLREILRILDERGK